MKRIVAASNKVNKVKLRQEFIKLATDIRDLSKYEFVTLLKNNTDTAVQWVNRLQKLYDEFEQDAKSLIQYYCVEVFVDGRFVGYLADVQYTTYHMQNYGMRTVQITSDIDQARSFANVHEAETALRDWWMDVTVLLEDGTGYKYLYPKCDKNPDIIGTLDEYSVNEGKRLRYVSSGAIKFEIVEL